MKQLGKRVVIKKMYFLYFEFITYFLPNKMARWRLQNHFSILAIFSDFHIKENCLNSDLFEETVAYWLHILYISPVHLINFLQSFRMGFFALRIFDSIDFE